MASVLFAVHLIHINKDRIVSIVILHVINALEVLLPTVLLVSQVLLCWMDNVYLTAQLIITQWLFLTKPLKVLWVVKLVLN